MAARHTNEFLTHLFEQLKAIEPAVEELELYEFRYILDNLVPAGGWDALELPSREEIEQKVNSASFYEEIQTRQKAGDKIQLDQRILDLTRFLLAGLARGAYPVEWVNRHFFFDVRASLFLHRTRYFTEAAVRHFGGAPFKKFTPQQQRFACFQGVGYQDFKQANREIDQAFIEMVLRLVAVRGKPILMTLAGPTAAGKTEIMERLFAAFVQVGKRITTLEMDNFLLDRDIRGEHAMGKGTHHFELFLKCLGQIRQGHSARIPRYDFVQATSSHSPDGSLKPGAQEIEIAPADIVFIEGNFPFQMQEVAPLIGIKVVYLTDDPVRLKRKWKRDIDYRKKYDLNFFINRYFKTQFLRAEVCYIPQIQACDIVVDTTRAELWVTPQVAEDLER